MVCEKCEKKLTKVIVPDKWKEGASNTTEGGGRKINENKLLSKKNSKLYTSQWETTHICDLTWRYWCQDFLHNCLCDVWQMDPLRKYQVHHMQAASASGCQVLPHLCLL
ncbi:hypothetical protein VIGAN_08058300 [Vigna angularis var. angularis]|uniref:Cysteine-rich PDZ-binding protein n=1 Tax=Vigna angularis var. angularis TaxID=157739 RepID=A0A0S3SMG1_PHAAN|nr:uncharacterized protein LOC108325329 isoform X1 [Vigna angularis]BAT94017.1 hypothetical protein VIGAN_08058300 [Vigna angularis var. angularis]